MQLCLQCIEELNTDGYQCSRDWIFSFFKVHCIFLFSLLQLPAVPWAKTRKLAGFHRTINCSGLSDPLSLKCCICRFSTNTFISSYLVSNYPTCNYVPILCVFHFRAAEHTLINEWWWGLWAIRWVAIILGVVEVVMQQTFIDVCSEVK